MACRRILIWQPPPLAGALLCLQPRRCASGRVFTLHIHFPCPPVAFFSQSERDCCFSAGHMAASGSQDNLVKLWSTVNGVCIKSLGRDSVTAHTGAPAVGPQLITPGTPHFDHL